ncbi:hypothetical protein O0L34_g16076 [Tuta absoluta]|nr:hypothetical protein O0L34_g16076 [Tuta absoluta]
MKEININIEGYNVNGICVGCLNYNRKMYYHKDIHNCFKNLANIDVPDGLSIQVCYECLAAVRNANRFREQILKAYDILMDYSAEHTFLNAPSDLSQYSVSRLSLTAPNLTNVGDLGVEPIVDDGKVEIELDVKSEMETELGIIYDPPDNLDTKPETDYSQDTISDYPDIPDVDIAPSYSSDEDIQLSLLKRKKERVKKGRKSKKEKKSRKDIDESEPQKFKMKEEQPKMTRKLKNLPENMVSLYTMTEEEMWQVRSEDLASKEFESVKYKCVDCIIGFNTERLMLDHMSGKHQPKSGDCKQCDVCKAYFLTKDNLATHRALHLTAYHCLVCCSVQCDVCKAYFLTKDNLTAYHCLVCCSVQCDVCKAYFLTKDNLTAYHCLVCRKQCDVCNAYFLTKDNLATHRALHLTAYHCLV